jgi:uncharacterized protein YqgV (UPF0045/DUF77 family)
VWFVIFVMDRFSQTERVLKLAETIDSGLCFKTVPRHTQLERQWDELMFLCRREKEYLADQTHRVLVKVLTRRIDELAREMGFGEAQIQGRNFRAEKTDGRITAIVTE